MNRKITLPHLGQRIIKTSVAVFICLIIHILTGFRGSPAQSTIAAIICIQPYITDSRTYAKERVWGTLYGSAWAALYLAVMYFFPFHEKMFAVYLIMAIFVLLSMYSAVILKQGSSAGLIAIIFIGTVVDYPNIDSSPIVLLGNLLDTIFGVLVAILVNIYHLPRRKHPEKLFFVRTMDLMPDRFTQVPSAIHIMLNYLYNDGAKICLISRWAPAFLISQMGLLNVNAPVICMDGAALYDMAENKYLYVIEIPKENAKRLQKILEEFGSFCSYYTVHERSLCIYRSGVITDAERIEYSKMKRSPYRNYMDGDCRDEDKIAFMRVIDTPERIDELAYKVQSVLPPGMFRMEIREEAQFPDFRGLYFYDPKANVSEMKEHVLAYMQEDGAEELVSVDMIPTLKNYRPENDALILLSRLKNQYEPIDLLLPFRWKTGKNKTKK